MDGMPGLIHSGDDFGVNSAGIIITETTISDFTGFDPNGVPEFVRARKAMQYAASIDDFARIMKEGNNGGYANNWLVADRKTNEVASLELGLKNVPCCNARRTVSSWARISPIDPEADPRGNRVRPERHGQSAKRAPHALAGADGAEQGQDRRRRRAAFPGRPLRRLSKKVEPSERTLCGHIDLSPRGMADWLEPYAPAGAVQNKVTDAALAEKMSMTAALGHACGRDFHAAPHLVPISELCVVWSDPPRHGRQAVDGIPGEIDGQAKACPT